MEYIEKACVLYERLCISCGECNYCDLEPEKICDNCMKCVQAESDYRAIRIDGVLTQAEALEEEGGDDRNVIRQ